MSREGEIYIKLWAAVLEKAIEDLNYDPPETREDLTNSLNSQIERELYWKEQAQAWFKSRSRVFNSFEGVCLILGLDSSNIRERLKEKGLL